MKTIMEKRVWLVMLGSCLRHQRQLKKQRQKMELPWPCSFPSFAAFPWKVCLSLAGLGIAFVELL